MITLTIQAHDDGAARPALRHRRGGAVSGAALQVARDALLEAGSIADVLDLARTMALERHARSLPVAWVGPVEPSARVLHVWVARPSQGISGASKDLWWVWRDGKLHTSGGHYGGQANPARWTGKVVRARLVAAVAVLHVDPVGTTPRIGPPHPTIGPEPTGRP